VRTQAAAGWTPELARQALSALRVGGAVALGRPVAQQVVGREVNERPGQVRVRTGLLRPRRSMLSASTTAPIIAAALSNGHGRSARRRVTLEQLADSLRTFNSAAYGRAADTDTMALNAALSDGTAAIKRLKATTMWPVRLFN
jgi:hypothetical protein